MFSISLDYQILSNTIYIANTNLLIFCVCRWHVCVLEDGHSVEDLCKAFHEATQVKGKPTAIVAKTLKGKGIPGMCFTPSRGKWVPVRAEMVLVKKKSIIVMFNTPHPPTFFY